MSDLERAQEWLGCDVTMDEEGGYYCSEHGDYLDHNGQCSEATRLTALLAETRADECEHILNHILTGPRSPATTALERRLAGLRDG